VNGKFYYETYCHEPVVPGLSFLVKTFNLQLAV